MSNDNRTTAIFPGAEVISNTFGMMSEASRATKDICVKLREMSRKTRACCDTLDKVLDISMGLRDITENLAEKVFTAATGAGEESANSEVFIDFMESSLDHACKLYEHGLDEICGQIEELSCIQVDMDSMYSDLEGYNDDYLEAIHLVMEHLMQGQDTLWDAVEERTMTGDEQFCSLHR